MATTGRTPRQWSCVVPYRSHIGRVEFCLVTPPKSNRWEFPIAAVNSGDPLGPMALLEAQEAGLRGRIKGQDPLGEFVSTRGMEERYVIAFLMEVTAFDELVAATTGRRQRWCFAEEARARIRRKPLRRLIDVAIRRLDGDTTTAPATAGANV